MTPVHFFWSKHHVHSVQFSIRAAPAPCPLSQWHTQLWSGPLLSSFTRGVRQVLSLDVKASGDACHSWSPVIMAWGQESASASLTGKLWVSALCDGGTTIQTRGWTVDLPLFIIYVLNFWTTCPCSQWNSLFCCLSALVKGCLPWILPSCPQMLVLLWNIFWGGVLDYICGACHARKPVKLCTNVLMGREVNSNVVKTVQLID